MYIYGVYLRRRRPKTSNKLSQTRGRATACSSGGTLTQICYSYMEFTHGIYQHRCVGVWGNWQSTLLPLWFMLVMMSAIEIVVFINKWYCWCNVTIPDGHKYSIEHSCPEGVVRGSRADPTDQGLDRVTCANLWYGLAIILYSTIICMHICWFNFDALAQGTDKLSWTRRGSNSRHPDWGNTASCQLSSTFAKLALWAQKILWNRQPYKNSMPLDSYPMWNAFNVTRVNVRWL